MQWHKVRVRRRLEEEGVKQTADCYCAFIHECCSTTRRLQGYYLNGHVKSISMLKVRAARTPARMPKV